MKTKPRAYMRHVQVGDTRVNVPFVSRRPTHVVALDYALQRIEVSTAKLAYVAAERMIARGAVSYTLYDAQRRPVVCVSVSPEQTRRGRRIVMDTAVH